MAEGIIVALSDEVIEPESDIVLKVDFQEGVGSAARPFEIAAELIRALEDLDNTLAKTVDSSIETTLIVEDLQKSSIKVFLRNLLRHADDDALKTLDWRPLIGQYLVKGKYAALRWLDSDEPHITDLTEEIARLANSAAEIHHLPAPPPPNPARLAQSLDKLQAVKRTFQPGEALTITLDRHEYKVDLDKTWMPSEVAADIQGERELVSDQELILAVRKPDMLGGSQWQFRLGRVPISAPIEDRTWMEEYRARRVVLMPGDALQVILRSERRFSERGELIETKHKVTRVISVIKSPPPPRDLFESDSDDEEVET